MIEKLLIPLLWLGLVSGFAVFPTTLQSLTPATTAAVTDLVGQSLHNESRHRIGKVVAVVIDVESGTAQYIIANLDQVHPFASYHRYVDGTFVTIPWAQVQRERHNNALTLSVESSRLRDAPRSTTLPDTKTAGWDAAVQAYWQD